MKFELQKSTLNQAVINTVLARDVHLALESKQDFSTWIKNRIEQGGFIEDADYCLLHNSGEQTSRGGSNKIEYFISIDMAKHISMMERNEAGKEARQYFIDVEKDALSIPHSEKQNRLAELEVEADQIKKNKVMVELNFQLEVAKKLGRSFDVNRFISDQNITDTDHEIITVVSTLVGTSLKELGGIDLEHKPVTQLLADRGVGIPAQFFNNMLEEIGILSGRIVTANGKRYGFNWRCADEDTQPRWYVDRFDELLNLMKKQGYL